MKNICKIIVQAFFITLVSIFILPLEVQSATQITGTVTAKQEGLVKIEFEPHKTAGPQSGDLVDFKTMIQGMEVNAGQGEVIESATNFAWVKITKGRPNLKMVAVIQATGDPAPKEYSLELPGLEFKARGIVYWQPNGIFRFNSRQPLSVTGKFTTPISFPDGGYFSTPQSWAPGVDKTLKSSHLERFKQKFEKKQESDTWQVVVESVWTGREVKGKNTVFYVSQAIETERFHNTPGPDRKIIREDKDQEFLISFQVPKPPSDNRTFINYIWELTFRIPDFADKQYRPEYWEKRCLEVLHSASVDLKGGSLGDPFKQRSPRK